MTNLAIPNSIFDFMRGLSGAYRKDWEFRDKEKEDKTAKVFGFNHNLVRLTKIYILLLNQHCSGEQKDFYLSDVEVSASTKSLVGKEKRALDFVDRNPFLKCFVEEYFTFVFWHGRVGVEPKLSLPFLNDASKGFCYIISEAEFKGALNFYDLVKLMHMSYKEVSNFLKKDRFYSKSSVYSILHRVKKSSVPYRKSKILYFFKGKRS